MTHDTPPVSVLLVEDDHRILVSVQAMLADAGCVVSTATDAYQAIAIVHSWHIDVVVTDIDMPGLSGIDLLKALATSHPGLPVVMMTGVVSPEGKDVAYALGAVAYLAKPLQATVLIDAVQLAVAGARSAW